MKGRDPSAMRNDAVFPGGGAERCSTAERHGRLRRTSDRSSLEGCANRQNGEAIEPRSPGAHASPGEQRRQRIRPVSLPQRQRKRSSGLAEVHELKHMCISATR